MYIILSAIEQIIILSAVDLNAFPDLQICKIINKSPVCGLENFFTFRNTDPYSPCCPIVVKLPENIILVQAKVDTLPPPRPFIKCYILEIT